MSVEPFPLDPEQPLRILGRDDAKLLYQSGLAVGVVYIHPDGSAHSAEIPIWRLQLAFGKRAGEGVPQPQPSREEAVGAALRQFANAMAGYDYDRTPCA